MERRLALVSKPLTSNRCVASAGGSMGGSSATSDAA